MEDVQLQVATENASSPFPNQVPKLLLQNPNCVLSSGYGLNRNVRPYVRSKVPRIRWTRDLDQLFYRVVQSLGGEDRATPRMILNSMGEGGLTLSQIKSHLQMYRTRKQEAIIQEEIAEEKRKGKMPMFPNPWYYPSRGVVSQPYSTRRQTRIEKLKRMLHENTAMMENMRKDQQLSNTIPVHVPEQLGRRSHSYLICKDLMKNKYTFRQQIGYGGMNVPKANFPGNSGAYKLQSGASSSSPLSFRMQSEENNFSAAAGAVDLTLKLALA